MRIKAEIEDNLNLEGSIDEVIQRLQDLKQRYEERDWTELEIEYDYYGYDGGMDIVLKGMREETRKEEKERLEKERRQKEREQTIKAKKLEDERKEYERLKKKFGGK